jgi:hypothetical protein
MSDRDQTHGSSLDLVEAKLRDLRRRKTVRWTMSHETAELAIAALAIDQHAARERKRRGKSRRRKRGKRLL